jgi:hypothetical protein
MMPSPAQRRHAKALRRRAVVTGKRKIEGTVATPSLAQRVHRAAAAPIHACLVQQDLFENGIGILLLARHTPSGEFALGFFLLDVFCLGIKDASFQSLNLSDLEFFIESIEATDPLVPIEPSHARKLLREAAAYAQSIGFSPHRDFVAVEPLFGEVNAEACEATFHFGVNGKPHYVPGPTESWPTIRRRVEQLRQRLGDDGFECAVALDEE